MSPSPGGVELTPSSAFVRAWACRTRSSVLKTARCGSRARAPCRPPRRARIAGAFSARTKRHTAGTSLEQEPDRSRSARGRVPLPRTAGSTQTCCSCTASGVHAEASALKRITPFSIHAHERPSSICARRPPAEAVGIALERVDRQLLHVGARAGRDEQRRGRQRSPRGARCRPAPAAPRSRRRAGRDGPRAGVAHLAPARVPELVDRALPRRSPSAPRSARGVGEGPAADARTERRSRRRGRARRARPSSVERREPAQAAPRDVLEEHALDRVSRRSTRGSARSRARSVAWRDTFSARPERSSAAIQCPVQQAALESRHANSRRASQGDYAEACLLPGDPLRAKYIAETFFEDVVQVNPERGMLGYTRHVQRASRVSVQSSGMGCPSAAS